MDLLSSAPCRRDRTHRRPDVDRVRRRLWRRRWLDAPSAAMVTLSVSPTTITLGQSATVTWSSNAGTNCTASGAWSGTQGASGTQSVTPTATGSASFTIACSSGAYSSSSATAKLTVNAASAFSLTSLVADTAGGTAAKVDANLVNAWGVSIAAAPATNPAWIANNHSETSTLYDGTGTAIPLVVNLPPNPDRRPGL